ncbi:hypothetical protein COV82_02120 [Candidatus Peregrinibacteria bacterium CG11_big_fil_rev_8_21_14_0_20_46_8]|nr:MAG: hypothetical protein COV82_02120 [Candidatus Peregrinibacteria bacterium CG11_big_fil_rev_8_21_14_0_20_46_8]
MDNLRPRFTIKKTKISGLPQNIEDDFVPENVIYAEIDDEITNIFDRIKQLPSTNIAIVIPKRAQVLQSLINLKILKKKIHELKKTVVIVTADAQGMQLVTKAGLPCVEKLIEQNAAKTDLPPKTLRGEKPVRLSKKKISISEVIQSPQTSPFQNFIQNIRERIRKRKKDKMERRFIVVTPNKQALFTLVLVTVLLLLSVAYIALPGATITITPRSSVLDASFNVTFADAVRNSALVESSRNENIVVASYPVNPPAFTRSFSYNATGKEFKGENARGIITITNKSTSPWDLVARTRFQTQDGLIFRIQEAVRVPPTRGGIPGTLDVEVIADEFDVNNQAISARGNIGPTTFFLPGLQNSENREKLTGESKAPMSGGITQIIKIVSEEDINAAKQQVLRELKTWAVEDLQKFLAEDNLVKRRNLSLLSDSNVIKIGEPDIKIDTTLVGQNAEKFEVTVTYRASSIAFDRSELVERLKARIANRADPDKKILSIDEENFTYKFLDENVQAGKVRLTTTMRAIQIYELDEDQENGRRFLKKISDHIAGLKVDEALSYLQRQSDEIARVEIKTWPIWAPTIPNIADNIKFVIEEERDLQ